MNAPRAPLLAVLVCLLPGGAGPLVAAPTAETALREGNRLFRAGRLEEALAAYAGGWDPRSPQPVLAYNLGTTAHHLGRLPEAVLWYRRAAPGLGGDRWLVENLARARRDLGTGAPAPPGLPARLAAWWSWLLAAGAASAWVWLALLLLGRGAEDRLWSPADLPGLVAGLLLLSALVTPFLAPRPAVLLEPCGGGEAALPAGAEVWGRPAEGGAFRIELPGTEILCPPGAAEPVGS